MNTIIINANKNNYSSYLYKLNNFSFTKEDITDIADITSDNYQNIPTSYSSTYYVNSKTYNSNNSDNYAIYDTIKQSEIEEIIDNNIDYLEYIIIKLM